MPPAALRGPFGDQRDTVYNTIFLVKTKLTGSPEGCALWQVQGSALLGFGAKPQERGTEMKKSRVFLSVFLCLCLLAPARVYGGTVEDVLKVVAAQALFAKVAPMLGLGPKKTDEEKAQEKKAKEEKKEKKEMEKEQKAMDKAKQGPAAKDGKVNETPSHMDLVIEWAKKGDVQAQCILSYAYATGQRVPKDNKLALEWQKKANEQNSALVKFFIPSAYGKKKVPLPKLFSLAGRRSHVGQFVEQNVDDAVRWCAMAAAEKEADGVSYLASAYYTGRGIKQDYKNALFCANLTKKNPLSLHVLIDAYRVGNGVEQNLEKSEYYRKYLELVVDKKRTKEKEKLLRKYEKEIEAGELYGVVR